MGVIWTPPKTLYSQPQVRVELDYNNPIVDSLAAFSLSSTQDVWTKNSHKKFFGDGVRPVTRGVAYNRGNNPASIVTDVVYSGTAPQNTGMSAFVLMGGNRVMLASDDSAAMVGNRGPSANTGFGFAATAPTSAGGRPGNSFTDMKFTLFGVADYKVINEPFGAGLLHQSYAFSWDGSFATGYHEGAKKDTIATGSYQSSSGNLELFGSRGNPGNFCDVSICLVVERALSDDEMFSLHANPWQIFQAPVNRTIFLPEAGGTTIDAGQATETNTAQSITPSRRAAVAQAAETSTAQSITPAKVVAVGQAIETSAAQSTTPSKTAAVGQATETNTAQSISPAATIKVQVGQAAETNTAQPVAPVQPGAVAVGFAAETDTAQPITPIKRVAVNTATETSTAQAIAAARRVAVGRALETSTAFAVTRVQDIIVSVGQASETSTAFSIASQVGTPTPNLFAPRGTISANRKVIGI